MSTKTLGDYKKPPHRRNNSGELDVFEASRYFSEHNDKNALDGTQEVTKDQVKQGYLRQGRASLDLPSLKQYYYKQYPQNYTTITQIKQKNHQIQQHKQENTQIIEKKKHKQPNSPSGKLANFLNTLFNQTILNSKKKKTTKSIKDDEEEENPSSRKLRRSSMSHIRSSSNVIIDSKTRLGFSTPPPYTIDTPTKSTLSKYKVHENRHANNVKDDRVSSEKPNWTVDINEQKCDHKRGIIVKKFDEVVDEGEESDDLFELQIDYEFEFSTSGLPVYETTHLDNFKRSSSSPITNGLIKV